MKKHFRYAKLLAYLTLVSFTFFVGCKNQHDQLLSGGDDSGISIEEAKRHLEKMYPSNSVRDSHRKQKKTPYDDSLDKRKMNWNKATKKALRRGETVVVPIEFGKEVLYKFKNPNSQTFLNYDYLNYAYMFKDSNQKIQTEWITLVPDSAWYTGDQGAYSGTILVRNWEGDFLRYYKYKDSETIEAYNVIDDVKNGRTNAIYYYEVCLAMYNVNCPAQVSAPNPPNDPNRCIIDVCKTITIDTDNPITPSGSPGGTGAPNNGGGQGTGSGGSGTGGDYVPSCDPNVPSGVVVSPPALQGCWMWAATPVFDPGSLVVYPVSREYDFDTPNAQATDWDLETRLYPIQNRPAWSTVYGLNGYPRQILTHPTWDKVNSDVYSQVGGEVLAMAQENPTRYRNACALRVSIALNKAGITIPYMVNRTYKGGDGKYYFLSVAKLFKFCKDTFGNPHVKVEPQSATTNVDYSPYFNGKKGIYIMRASNPGQFGAEGHATLWYGTNAIQQSDGSDGRHFIAAGGVEAIYLFQLP